MEGTSRDRVTTWKSDAARLNYIIKSLSSSLPCHPAVIRVSLGWLIVVAGGDVSHLMIASCPHLGSPFLLPYEGIVYHLYTAGTGLSHLHTDLGHLSRWLTLRRACTKHLSCNQPATSLQCPNSSLIFFQNCPGMENDYLYVGVWKGKRVRGTQEIGLWSRRS
jgi:hypothetical protein